MFMSMLMATLSPLQIVNINQSKQRVLLQSDARPYILAAYVCQNFWQNNGIPLSLWDIKISRIYSLQGVSCKRVGVVITLAR